jgi:hypothetical protein
MGHGRDPSVARAPARSVASSSGRDAGAAKEAKIEKWWEVKRHLEPPLTRGATPIVERCIRVLGWSESFAKRTLKGYRQLMELKSIMNDWEDSILVAPAPIQLMWEQHILDNLNYAEDCLLLFGRVVGHYPDSAVHESEQAISDRVRTTQIAFQARFGADLDEDVWDYNTKIETAPEADFRTHTGYTDSKW